MKAAKNALLLGLPALLIGCGGSSSGGGGSPAPAPTKYTWQFVQMKQDTLANMEAFCNQSNPLLTPTIFNTNEAGAEPIYTYAAKAPTVTDIQVFNADGTLYSEGSLNRSDVDPIDGTLTFTENDIPDGGYIVVLDEWNGVDNVLAIEKSLLSDALVKINREQGLRECYSDGALTRDEEAKKVNVSAASGMTSVETYLNGKLPASSASIKADLNVLENDDIILISGYNNANEIVEYAYVDKDQLVNDDVSETPNTVFLDSISDASTTIDFTTAAGLSFTELTLKSQFQDFTYNWFSWSASDTSFVIKAPLDTQYSYATEFEGQTTSWAVKSYQTVESGYANLNLSDLSNINDAVIPLTCSASSCSFNAANAVTTLNSTATKLRFDVNGSGDTAKYTIFAETDAVVPQIAGVEYPTVATPLSISMLIDDSSDTVLQQAFMVLGNTKNYDPNLNEYIDLVLQPSKDLEHQQKILSVDHTVISQ